MMATQVVMPQMGESIAEGTIVRWIKKIGDNVDRDEPLFEISTDKVDAEIPSPGAGVLLEIKVKEGETVPVNSVVAVIGAANEAQQGSAKPASAQHSAPPPPAASSAADGSAAPPPFDGAQGAPSSGRGAPDAPKAAAATTSPTSQPVDIAQGAPSGGRGAHEEHATNGSGVPTAEMLRRTKSSPVVRKIAREHDVDITRLSGTGLSGRVTKQDILAHLEERAATPAKSPAPVLAFKPGEQVRIEKMGIMRKKIAEHMVMSVHTSPHVYSAYEVDFSHIEKIRQAKKAEYEAVGAKLTYTAFIAKATVETIRQFPFTNASLDGENIVYTRDINLGIAVALEQGLIVPVVRNADERNMLGLSRAIQDIAHRARTKQLKPDEVQGGTFTITNPGIFGA